jgi:hypothetical protein
LTMGLKDFVAAHKPVKSFLHVWNSGTGVWDAWSGAITTGDIEIGAVELKNATTDQRATINGSAELLVKDTTADGLLATIDANTDRNTAFEIVEVSLANDDWANVTFAQAVKSFELQHQALTTDFQFRKSADTEYLTIGAGNTKHFPVSGLTTVGQVKRTGAATIVISAIGYY